MTVDLTARIGSVTVPNPVMTASGTAGHGVELADYLDLDRLGAHVVKSLSVEPWAGNPAPRVHEIPGGMINSVGLQNPGVAAWRAEQLPELEAGGVRVVASIWGRAVEDYAAAADALADAGPSVIAVEINLSCPNLHGGRLVAHDPAATAEVVAACSGAGRPCWAKLSPNTDRLVDVAGAAADAGAEAVTLVNTVQGLALNDAGAPSRAPRLGGGGGGVSGPAIRHVALRAVAGVRAEHPDLPIVGVGGVTGPDSAVDLLAAGASAVQIGTATFADPRAPIRVLDGIETWCRRRGVTRLADLTGSLDV